MTPPVSRLPDAASRSPECPACRHGFTRRVAMGLSAGLLAGAALAAEPVEVDTLELQPVRSGAALALDGSLEAQKQATVAAQVAGNVLNLAVKAGDRVRRGQVLARIDDALPAAGLAEGEAALAQADALRQRARTEVQRTRELRAQGFVSQAALDDAETRARAAEAGWQQASAARSQAAVTRGHSAVSAPFDGVVLATHLDIGDLASPGRPVLTLYVPGALRAVVQVPARLAAQAREAKQVEVEMGDGRRVAPVRRTTLPGADPVAQTVEWRLDLAAADSAGLQPGQSVRVQFAGSPQSAGRAVPRVPAGAVLRRGELTAVYVVQGDHFVLRAVRAGAHGGDTVELLAGVRSGEHIAVDAVRAGLQGARPTGAATASR